MVECGETAYGGSMMSIMFQYGGGERSVDSGMRWVG